MSKSASKERRTSRRMATLPAAPFDACRAKAPGQVELAVPGALPERNDYSVPVAYGHRRVNGCNGYVDAGGRSGACTEIIASPSGRSYEGVRHRL